MPLLRKHVKACLNDVNDMNVQCSKHVLMVFLVCLKYVLTVFIAVSDKNKSSHPRMPACWRRIVASWIA
jgi:hypothetical protein